MAYVNTLQVTFYPPAIPFVWQPRALSVKHVLMTDDREAMIHKGLMSGEVNETMHNLLVWLR